LAVKIMDGARKCLKEKERLVVVLCSEKINILTTRKEK